jgi:hypothetical protein
MTRKTHLECHGNIESIDGTQFVSVSSDRDGIKILCRRDDADVVLRFDHEEASELIGNIGRACRWHKRVREFAP